MRRARRWSYPSATAVRSGGADWWEMPRPCGAADSRRRSRIGKCLAPTGDERDRWDDARAAGRAAHARYAARISVSLRIAKLSEAKIWFTE